MAEVDEYKYLDSSLCKQGKVIENSFAKEVNGRILRDLEQNSKYGYKKGTT